MRAVDQHERVQAQHRSGWSAEAVRHDVELSWLLGAHAVIVLRDALRAEVEDVAVLLPDDSAWDDEEQALG